MVILNHSNKQLATGVDDQSKQTGYYCIAYGVPRGSNAHQTMPNVRSTYSASYISDRSHVVKGNAKIKNGEIR